MLELQRLLDNHEVTKGLGVRAHGSHLILSRDEIGPDGISERDDRVRLTHLQGTSYGLSVRRHTGRWQKTPFIGSLPEMVEVICTSMQHLVAAWP